MEKGTASVTMSLPAVLRAAHQLIDGNPKILEDPVAPRLIDESERERMLMRDLDVQSPFMKLARSFFLVRSRFAEDQLKASLERGISQYVMLGAGLDTFAYRQPEWAKDLQIYEVDHPKSQLWKRERLASKEIPVPQNLHFLSIDFDNESLAEGMLSGGFDRGGLSFVSCLGVLQYLPWSAFKETMKFVMSLPKFSEIVVTFNVPESRLTGEDLQFARIAAEQSAARGEPWISRFEPEDLKQRLHDLGFSTVAHLSPESAQERYFQGRTDGLRAPQLQQLMQAIV